MTYVALVDLSFPDMNQILSFAFLKHIVGFVFGLRGQTDWLRFQKNRHTFIVCVGKFRYASDFYSA